MKNYMLIPHTADVRLRVEADSVEELFIASLEGMNRTLNKKYERELNGHIVIREISVSSVDLTSLLIDFLSEVLTLSYNDRALFYNVDFLEIEETNLHAHIVGTKISHFGKDIKGVTYSEAEIRKNTNGKYETVIVFDI